MTKFTFSIGNPEQQIVHIRAEFEVQDDLTDFFLPVWRPGRYELGNFAKNVIGLKCFNEKEERLHCEKVSLSHWQVITKNTKRLIVEYRYYGHLLNSGSTYLDHSQLYVNPVNCCVFTDEVFHQPVKIELEVPASWQIAGSMPSVKHVLSADDFEDLFDSPFIASDRLQHNTYDSHGVCFHIWFNGEVKPEWDLILGDFKRFTDAQIAKFTEFPAKEYHFLFQILPIKAYHGVEHIKSTVVTLGPSWDIFKDTYSSLLGVSSHELYHAWNVKTLRPADMYPYNFKTENFTRMGYLTEGVTTYQGDMFLWKSEVFNEEQFIKEFTGQFQKHFDNPGRFNYSVRESSFDTWLDGYEPGVPGRKVSIYTEGCLLAFVTDVFLMRHTNCKSGLNDLMKRLYFDYALQHKGIQEHEYIAQIENMAGTSFQELFDTYFRGTAPFESILVDALDFIGYDLEHGPSPIFSEAKLGFKVSESGGKTTVTNIYSGSPAELGGLMVGDQIIAVNECDSSGALDKWLNYFKDDHKQLLVNRDGRFITLILPEVNRNFFMKYSLVKKANLTVQQKRAFDKWYS